MPRKKLNIDSMKPSTLRKYSKSQIESMRAEEEYIKNSMSSQLEDWVITKIRKKGNKSLFYIFKQILEKLNVYSSTDSMLIQNIIENLEGIAEAKEMIKRAKEMGDISGFTSLKKLILSYQKENMNILKELGLTLSVRHKLVEMTSNGDLQSEDVSADDMEMIMKILEGDK